METGRVKDEPMEFGVTADTWRKTAGRGVWLAEGADMRAVGAVGGLSGSPRFDQAVQTMDSATSTANAPPTQRPHAVGRRPEEAVFRPVKTEVAPAGGCHFAPMRLQLPPFNGKTDWEAYQAQFEMIAEKMQWSPAERAFFLASKLTEDALVCITMLSPEERGDYDALVSALRQRFGADLEQWTLSAQLGGRRRRPKETLNALYGDIKVLSQRAYSNMPPAVRNQLARDRFVEALSPLELRRAVQLAHPSTIEEALKLAVERESVWALPANDAAESTQQSPAPTTKPEWVEDLAEAVKTLSKQVGQLRHSPCQQPVVKQEAVKQPSQGTRACFHCGDTSHLIKDCPKHRGQSGNASGSR